MKSRVLVLVFLLVTLVGFTFLAGCGSVGGLTADALNFMSTGGGGGPVTTSGWTRIGTFTKDLKWIYFSFGNPDAGMVVGTETISQTADGGGTWTPVTLIDPDTETLTAKTFNYFYVGTHQWAIGNNGRIFWNNAWKGTDKSTRGWGEWKKENAPYSYGYFPSSTEQTAVPIQVDWRFISFAGSHGLLIGNYANGGAMVAYTTSDNGSSWTEFNLTASNADANTQLYGCKVVEADKYRIAGASPADDKGVFLTYNDINQGWSIDKAQPQPFYGYQQETYDWFPCKSGYLSKFLTTTKTFAVVKTATNDSLHSLDIYLTDGWAVGDGGQIVTSKDSGDTWNTSQSSTVIARLNSVVLADRKEYTANTNKWQFTLYACGNSGALLKNVELRDKVGN